MWFEGIIKTLVSIAWISVSLLSANHLFHFSAKLVFSSHVLGLLGWATILGTIFYLAKSFRYRMFLVFILFFLFGFWRGPFLEPPSDPFEHLRRIQNFIGASSSVIPRENRGLWHYSMAGNIIGLTSGETDPDRILMLLDVTHGLFLALLMAALFVLGRRAGLNNRWAFFSCLIAFLFMGTSNFSYFTYYSLAPSYTSMLILWLWTSAFFFRQGWKVLLQGLFFSLISLPALWVNHCQEAVFMAILTGAWLGVNGALAAWRHLPAKKESGQRRKYLLLYAVMGFVLVLLLFALPQFDGFRNFLSAYFVKDRWFKNHRLVFTWNGLFLWGEFWAHRIQNTLGYIAVAMLVVLVPFFRSGYIQGTREWKIRIAVLAILPFLVYSAPLLNYIWASNVLNTQYYRLCYISMFWLLFAAVLQGFERNFQPQCNRNVAGGTARKNSRNRKIGVYYVACILLLLSLGSIRSAPVFGKLDFILLDSRPWWPAWKPMVSLLLRQGDKPILSDPITSTVLYGVFGQKTALHRRFFHSPKLKIEKMDHLNRPTWERIPFGPFVVLLGRETFLEEFNPVTMRHRGSVDRPYRCVVNLQGFAPTWVPKWTRHWMPSLANTDMFYRYYQDRGEAMLSRLRRDPPKNCDVYY